MPDAGICGGWVALVAGWVRGCARRWILASADDTKGECKRRRPTAQPDHRECLRLSPRKWNHDDSIDNAERTIAVPRAVCRDGQRENATET